MRAEIKGWLRAWAERDWIRYDGWTFGFALAPRRDLMVSPHEDGTYTLCGLYVELRLTLPFWHMEGHAWEALNRPQVQWRSPVTLVARSDADEIGWRIAARAGVNVLQEMREVRRHDH